MIKSFSFLFILLLANALASGQMAKMEIEGAIQIGNSVDPMPHPGTIRWTGADFEGWNGLAWVSLTGNAIVGSVTDIDGNTYRTIRVGDQEWMAENLRVTRYNDKNSIAHISDALMWSGQSAPAWCWYDNDRNYDAPYGKLYNWYAVATGKLCPTGWHVPTMADWTILIDFLGGENKAGGKIKEVGLNHWQSPNTGATNESSLTGLPGGTRDENGTYVNIGSYGIWWSSTASSISVANCQIVSYFGEKIISSGNSKGFGNSVRCLRD